MSLRLGGFSSEVIGVDPGSLEVNIFDEDVGGEEDGLFTHVDDSHVIAYGADHLRM